MQVSPAESGFVSSSSGLKAMGVNQNKTAKLFHMMSSTLYADKHMSILRELCSNARDSHAEAGKLDTPFAIIAPSHDYQFLVVSDVGTGITYEKACTTILEFLSSTKDEGEDAEKSIGGWGIGAKVPRAYTDNYQVYLRKGGIEWIVQVINDMAGLPQQMLMSEHKTHKPDGVDFVVPIQEVHINLWREKVVRYMENTNYNVIAYMGAGEVVVPGKSYRSYEFDNFILEVRGSPSRNGAEYTTVEVIYGGMVYRIPSEFDADKLQKDICKMVHRGLKLYIRLDTPNAVRCGLSREQLEVDDANKNLLLRALMVVEEDLNNLKRPAHDLLDEDTRNGYSSEPVWGKIVELSNQLKAASQQAGARSRLSALFKGTAYTVRWSPDGLLRDSNGSSVTSTGHTVNLPLSDDDIPVIGIKYSDKRLTRSDIYFSGNGLKIECPIRTHDLTAVREWAEAREDLKGLKLEYSYVTSSWSASSGSGSGAQRLPYAMCDITGKRVELSASRPRLMIPSAKYMWLGSMHIIGVFMPKKSFRKNRVVEGSVVEFEDFIKTDLFKQAQERLKYSRVSVETEKTLELAYKHTQVREYWPAILYTEIETLRTKISDLRLNIEGHKRLRSGVEQLWGVQDLLGGEKEPDITALMRESNQWIVRKEKEDNLYKVVNVDNLLEQFKQGNPEATRLMWAMKLEHFL